MCGIVGLVSGRGVDSGRIREMLRCVTHRGPDDSGIWLNEERSAGFGHARLSIIDLSPSGHQPMVDKLTGNVVVFNGEIYNFLRIREELQRSGERFRTGTDTEVILASYRRWGTECILRFNGMFAFALYDAARRTVVIARDRIGKKPLFYRHAKGMLQFASEAKAILAAEPDINWPLNSAAVDLYFAFGYILGEQSIFEGIKRLAPGSLIEYGISSDVLSLRPYWELERVASARSPIADIDGLLDELERLLDDSVRLRLIADVPLGVLLSGGVDSSLITALAARHQRHVKTFTVTFPGAGRYDEARHARVVADHFDTEHHELPLPVADFDLLRRVAAHLDEPLGDPSIVPTFAISELTRRHVTVALGGDGGDELFGGYGWYRAGLIADRRMRRVPVSIRRGIAVLARRMPVGMRGRNFLISHSGDLCDFLTTTMLIFDEQLRRRLLRPAIGNGIASAEKAKRNIWRSDLDGVTAMSMVDLRSYLPDDILVKVDRASMAFALEMRAPLLDYRVIEFALQSVPSHLKASTAEARYLERLLGSRLLPKSLDLTRKQGFVMPVHQWFRGSWADATLEAVKDGEARAWVDAHVVKNLISGQRKGRTNGMRLFSVAMFALWLHELRRSRPPLVATDAAVRA